MKSTCMPGKYILYGICSLDCDKNCYRCSETPTNCIACSDSTFLDNAECKNSCPDGKWEDSVIHECRRCSSPCANCKGIGAQDCITCEDSSKKILKGMCVSKCPQNYWEDSTTLICNPCDSSCNTCTSSGSSSACTSCPPGSYPSGDTFPTSCSKCAKECLECNKFGCTKCETGLVQNFLCVDSCSSNYFKSDSACLPCYGSCSTCKDETINGCTSCPLTSVLTLFGACSEKCDDGSWN